MTAKWKQGSLPTERMSYDEGAKCYAFDRESAKTLMHFMIDNAFLMVGDEVYRQVRGIPMGVSPAMYFANYYLFAYEYTFLRDAIQAYHSAALGGPRKLIRQAMQSFQFVGRYADDEVIINRPFLDSAESLLYVDQQHAGLHGIYPSSLNLVASGTPPFRVLHALDVTIKPAHETGGPLMTHLYDKRRDAHFQGVTSFVRFPAADSMLAWSCKLNVFNAQFKRFSRAITDVYSFKAEVVRLMSEMIQGNYPTGTLLHRCRRCCNVTPFLFGAARGTGHTDPHVGRPGHGLYAEIKHDLNV